MNLIPSITAIIPTYNRASFISDAIASILDQSRPIDEIIVVDDGSTDNTNILLKSFGNRINYIKQRNCGPGAARNRGIREASGDYIAFLDSDDLWVKDKTEIQLDFFNRHRHIDLVFGDMSNFSETVHDDGPEIKNKDIHDYLESHSANLDKILDFIIEENVIPTPSVMMKRECIQRIGFFDENLKIAEDFDYWIRASLVCRIGFINAVLVKRRKHPGNLVNDWVNRNLADIIVLSRISSKKNIISPQTQKLLEQKFARIHYDLGSYYFKKRDFKNAYFHLNRELPNSRTFYKWLIKLMISYLLRK